MYCDWIMFVPDIFIPCLYAHSWNNWGTSCHVSYTSLQATSLNPSGIRIPSLNNSSFANFWWTQNCRLSPVLDVIFSFPTNITTGYSGNISWAGKCSPSIPQRTFFAWSSIIKFIWYGRDKYWYAISSSRCAFTCE